MKSSFWTNTGGKRQFRDLRIEENQVHDQVLQSYWSGKIDEPVVIYYEVYNCTGYLYLNNNIYQHDTCYIKENDIVLDLGANIGIFTNFASDSGAKKVYSFEPVMQNFEMLLMNRPDNCDAHRMAITDTDNIYVDIYYKEDCPGGSSIVYPENGIPQRVMGITISTLINNGIIEQPDFIKMDIEGAENHAFNGMSDEHLLKTRCIAMEMHGSVIGKDNSNKIYERLESLGFNSFTLFNPGDENIVWFTNTALFNQNI